jgi:elongation factor G
MQDYKAPDIRNCALVGHAATGKTLLCDAILVTAGKIGRIGSIEGGTTVSDFHEDEKQHQVSIHATAITTDWLDREINIIDCPGSPDFISEPLSALRVSDFALITVSGTSGVEVGTDEVFHAADAMGIPKFFVINQLDKEHTRFDEIVDELREHFGGRVFPLTVPVDAGPGFSSVLDVMRSEVITYASNGSGKFEEKPADGADLEKVTTLHKQLIEAVAEADDALMEKFFEEETLSEDEIREHLHEAVQQGLVVPVFAVAAASNVGVSRMLDFVAKYGPSPVDRAKVKGGKTVDGEEAEVSLDDKDTLAFVFKTMHESHVGTLVSFFRVYSGDVSPAPTCATLDRNNRALSARSTGSTAPSAKPVDSLHAGDIGAVVKLRNDPHRRHVSAPVAPLVLPPVDFPPPNTRGAFGDPLEGRPQQARRGPRRAARGGPDLRRRTTTRCSARPSSPARARSSSRSSSRN